MASLDFKDGSDRLEAGLYECNSNGVDDGQLNSSKHNPYATSPQPELDPSSRLNQRPSFVWKAILIFLAFYIFSFMALSRDFRFMSCMHGASPDAPADGEAVAADEVVDIYEAQDLTPDPPTEEVMVPPTLVILERRQEDGNSSTSISSSIESSSTPIPTPSTSSSAQESTTTLEESSSSSSAVESTSSESVSPTTSSSGPPQSTTSSQSSEQTTSSFEESSTSAESSTSEEESTSETPTTSSEIRHTYTTTLPGGEPTTVTETTWVGVSPSSQITGGAEPELQNNSAALRTRMGVPLMMAVAMSFVLLA